MWVSKFKFDYSFKEESDKWFFFLQMQDNVSFFFSLLLFLGGFLIKISCGFFFSRLLIDFMVKIEKLK